MPVNQKPVTQTDVNQKIVRVEGIVSDINSQVISIYGQMQGDLVVEPRIGRAEPEAEMPAGLYPQMHARLQRTVYRLERIRAQLETIMLIVDPSPSAGAVDPSAEWRE